MPTPTAAPFTAASSGLPKVAMPRRNRDTGLVSVSGGRSRKSFRSLPAVKQSRAPWISTTRTAASPSAAASASAIAPYIAWVKRVLLVGPRDLDAQYPVLLLGENVFMARSR